MASTEKYLAFTIVVVLATLHPSTSSLNHDNTSSVAWTSCPTLGHLADCSRRGLSALPVGVPQWIKILDLSKNNINTLEGLPFQQFQKTNLSTLILSGNNISDLDDGIFFGLENLKTLVLDENQMTVVRPGLFYGISSVKILRLARNQIDYVNPASWMYCKNLQKLYIDRNRIQNITKNSFAGLANLRVMDLSNNEISFIEQGAFKDLTSLETLDLNHNNLWITIEDTKGPFVGLDRLTYLNLAHNNVNFLARQAFSGLGKLRTLDLMHNPIMSTEEMAFANLKSIWEVKFNSSNFLCDCKVKSLLQWLKAMEKTPTNHAVAGAKCHYPKALRGVRLLDLDIEPLVCVGYLRPYMMEMPQTQIALRETNVTLMCQAASTSDSPLTFRWRKDDQFLDSDNTKNHVSTYAQVSNKSGEISNEYANLLHLNNVTDSDAGQYQCVGSNAFGNVYSTKSEIRVHVLPTFAKSPKNTTNKVGQTARLECAAVGLPPPEISWQKDGGDNFPAAIDRRMHVMPDDDVFFIVDVKIEDMGVYSCRASNDAGVVITNATLTVLDSPKFVKPMGDKKTEAGEMSVLECMAAGSPRPNVTWTKDGGPFLATERHFFTADNQLLIIVQTQPSDAGRYSCEMTNMLGSADGALELTVVAKSSSIFRADWLPGRWTSHMTIITVIVVVVLVTSVVWVCIIYKTRRPEPEYYSETGMTTLAALEKEEKELMKIER